MTGLIWSIAETLRGDFKQFEYGKFILPFVVMRRLDCVLEGSKDAVLKAAEQLPDDIDETTRDTILFGIVEEAVGWDVGAYNLSRFTFWKLHGQEPGQLHDNLIGYITKFSDNVRDILLEKFRFTDQIKRLHHQSDRKARPGHPAPLRLQDQRELSRREPRQRHVPRLVQPGGSQGPELAGHPDPRRLRCSPPKSRNPGPPGRPGRPLRPPQVRVPGQTQPTPPHRLRHLTSANPHKM